MKNLTLIGVSVVVGIAIYAALFLLGDLDSTIQAVMSFSPGGWIVVLGLSLANYVVRFVRFDRYIRSVSSTSPKRLRHFLVYLGGFALTTTPGKAGELIRSVYLRVDSVPLSASLGAFAMERVMDLLAIALLAIMIVQDQPQFRWIAPAVVAVVLLVVLLLHKEGITVWLRELSDRYSGRLRAFIAHSASTLNNTKRLLRPSTAMGGLVAGVFAWSCEGVAFSYILTTLGADVSIVQAIGIYGLSMLLGAISFVPGGLGSTEIVMSLLLTGQGVSLETAVAATVICRVATLWFAVLLGAIALLILTRLYKDERADAVA